MTGAARVGVVALLLATACGKREGVRKLDVAQINALVPADLKPTLVFEMREMTTRDVAFTKTFRFAAPRGWEHAVPTTPRLDGPAPTNGSSFEVDTNCDGACEPKDWAAIAERVHFAPERRGTLVKEERGDTTHLMIVDRGSVLYIVYAWWTADAPRYAACRIFLDKPLAAAAPAFVAACQGADIQVR